MTLKKEQNINGVNYLQMDHINAQPRTREAKIACQRLYKEKEIEMELQFMGISDLIGNGMTEIHLLGKKALICLWVKCA